MNGLGETALPLFFVTITESRTLFIDAAVGGISTFPGKSAVPARKKGLVLDWGGGL